jgi:hypothetical protein
MRNTIIRIVLLIASVMILFGCQPKMPNPIPN